MSFFPSRHRCCSECQIRTIKVNGREVTEYFHRGVVCHLIGFEIALPLDLELIRPGEGEVVAAKRLLERVFRNYPRFFDAIVVDAIYLEAPFINLCIEHKKEFIAVIKDERRYLFQDAEGLFQTMKPKVWRQDKLTVKYWDEEGFTTCTGVDIPMRVLKTEETKHLRKRVGNKWVYEDEHSTWMWVTTIPKTIMSSFHFYQAAHHRWDIENNLFNTLVTHWKLNHCYKHNTTAIVNFVLTLFIAFILAQCFYFRNLKPEIRSFLTMISLTDQIFLGLSDYIFHNTGRRTARSPPDRP